MYWYRCDVYYTYMWTMATIYSSAVLVCLIYINIASIDYEIGVKHQLWKLFLVGIIAGSMHEVISLCTLSIIGTQLIIAVKKNKKNMKQIIVT